MYLESLPRTLGAEERPGLLSAVGRVPKELGDQGHEGNQPAHSCAWGERLVSSPLWTEDNHHELL